MTKVTIDRELLEQVASEFEHDNDRYMLGRELRKALVSPAASQQGDGLEVVGYTALQDLAWQGDCTLRKTPMLDYDIALCRLSDAQRAIAELREECEHLKDCQENAMLHMTGLVAERDTLRQQLAEQDAQIARMRAEVTPFIETHWRPVAHQRDKLADLLDGVKSDLSAAMNWGDLDRIAVRIDAALAEIDNGN